jgi:hypothetical protein
MLITVPSAAIATIEVKATYNSTQMCKALLNVAKARSLMRKESTRSAIWSGIFFTNKGNVSEATSFAHNIKDMIEDPTAWRELSLAADNRLEDLLPSCIGVMGFGVLCFGRAPDEQTTELRFFDCGEYSAAITMAHLFSYVRLRSGSDSLPGELDDVISQLTSFKTEFLALNLPTGNVIWPTQN